MYIFQRDIGILARFNSSESIRVQHYFLRSRPDLIPCLRLALSQSKCEFQKPPMCWQIHSKKAPDHAKDTSAIPESSAGQGFPLSLT